MSRLLRRLAVILLVLYACAIGVLFGAQRSLLYPASDRRTTAVEAGLDGFTDLILTTPDGERLVAWWKPPQPGKAVLLYFHGNSGSLWNRRLRAQALTTSGRGLLMVSYRGYSGSTGAPTEEGLVTDAQTAYAWVSQSYEPSRLVAYGESLGTGVAVRLASERRLGGLILDAPYTSTADVASLIYWYVPVRWLMLDQFRSLDLIQQVRAPILILHGTADRVVPFSFGERLYEAAPEPKQFVRLEGLGHSTNLEQGGLEAVDAFLAGIEAKLQGRPWLRRDGTFGARALEGNAHIKRMSQQVSLFHILDQPNRTSPLSCAWEEGVQVPADPVDEAVLNLPEAVLGRRLNTLVGELRQWARLLEALIPPPGSQPGGREQEGALLVRYRRAALIVWGWSHPYL